MRRLSTTLLLGIITGIVLIGCGAIGGALVEGDIESAGGGSAELELAQQQVETFENRLNTIREELTATKDSLAKAQEQVNKSEEQLRSELMVQIEEEINRISLKRARLQAVQYAQQNQDVSRDVANQQLVREVSSAQELDEFYYVELNYQPFGVFDGTPGLKESIMEKDCTIAIRQVISQSDANGDPSAQEHPEAQAGGKAERS